MTLNEAKAITGGISFPSKLKGTAAASSLHPGACFTGAKLSLSSDKNVCFKCFGKKGRFGFPSVQHSLWNRTEIVKRLNVDKDPLDYDKWIAAWVRLIKHYSPKYFRHFMVGDIQSLNHYYAIRAICADTPTTKHWLPTLEWERYSAGAHPPDNCIVRWTWPKVNQRNIPRKQNRYFTTGQTQYAAIVVKNGVFAPLRYFKCPATFHPRLKTCKAHSCTKCWEPHNIAYKEH